jgi:hypothetical protein
MPSARLDARQRSGAPSVLKRRTVPYRTRSGSGSGVEWSGSGSGVGVGVPTVGTVQSHKNLDPSALQEHEKLTKVR